MNEDNYSKHELAVSEAVGFIIIFGIVMAGIGLVSLYGYPALLNQQATANIGNMEKNFLVLQSDINTLAYKSVQYKETSMQVSGGVLSVVKPPTSVDDKFSIRIMNSVGPIDETIVFPSGELQFKSDSGEVTILLQNGAVVKWQSGGSVMLSDPRWFIDTDTDGIKTIVVTLVQVDSVDSLATSGISNIQLSVEPLNVTGYTANFIDFPVTSSEYTIRIKPPIAYSKAWTNYFDDPLEMTQVGPTTSWERSDIDRIVIKTWKINVINL